MNDEKRFIMHWDLRNKQILTPRVSLELSLKPFRSIGQADIEATCKELFTQWLPLLRKTSRVAVMMWLGDGSEILEYTGDMANSFEWAKWIGMADAHYLDKHDPEVYSLHRKAESYMENPPIMKYTDINKIVSALKSQGEKVTGLPVEVGTTFDPGPEFAISDFKFGRHSEIAAHKLDGGIVRWVTCTASLNEDHDCYAGFPNGIPHRTHIGTFLGRQCQHFLTDMGMDFIWFSNGFAFAANAWSCTGELFDGDKFDNKRAIELQDDILEFWKLFRQECPTFSIETRGSNLSTGMDLSAHGSPLKAIYEGEFDMAAPPNSPWAALNGNYGLELVGWMSHIANLPKSGKFPFRYYIHDPWWLNSPWFDRYGREPHDIYLPLSVARIDEDGKVNHPTTINFLSADTSYGQLPDRCPIEVIPHIVKALDDFSDQPGVATWIYPFDEYHQMVSEGRLSEIFFGDWFICGAVNRGLPLNTVVSSNNFIELEKKNSDVFKHTILISRVPDAGSTLETALIASIAKGMSVLLYGPIDNASDELMSIVGIKPADLIKGELQISTCCELDEMMNGTMSNVLEHNSLFSGGNINTILANDTGVTCIASVTNQEGEERVYATFSKNGHETIGEVAWIRGSFNYKMQSRLPSEFSPSERYPVEALTRLLLAQFGYSFSNIKRTLSTRESLIMASMHDNGYIFSGFHPTTTLVTKLRFPKGAPILLGCETLLVNGFSQYTMPRAWHKECRIVVDGQQNGEISCVEAYPLHTDYRRSIIVDGLDNATVRIMPEKIEAMNLHISDNVNYDTMKIASLPYQIEDDGRIAVIRSISGSLRLSW